MVGAGRNTVPRRGGPGAAGSGRRAEAVLGDGAARRPGGTRVGDRRETKAALKRGAVALAALPTPEHPEHHMVFDGGKLAFFSADCYAWLGMPEQAEEYVCEVIRQCGNGRRRGRLSSVHVDLGLARAQRGEIDGAAEAGQQALSMFDKPPPGTLWRAA